MFEGVFEMQMGCFAELSFAGLGLFAVLSGHAQDAPQAGWHTRPYAQQIIREILDPNNGDRWLLTLDARHPAGPGLLIRVHAGAHHLPASDTQPASESRPTSVPLTEIGSDVAPPIIHVGDRIIVEEDSAVAESWLEAAAMEPAIAGATFQARLTIGGRVIHAVAVARGEALLGEEKP
jgi:hypothetical protein